MIRVYFVLAFKALSVAADPSDCDSVIKPVTKEGNVGETSVFPWLGVLRVHLHDEGSFKIALTGIVYVKEGYAIANADDVARIPKRIFKGDSKAMFIPKDNSPWTCNLVDYMTHPEYQYSTMNTIALLELDLGMESRFPMKPICWPPYSFNTSNELYAIGFTDENTLLEKSVYSLQYVDQKLCQEFYNRAGITEKHLTPTHCQCGFAKNNKDNCVWDNGMALASNSTEYWTLVGFGIRGPGCAAPARFMDILPFLPWIDSATNAEEIEEDQFNFRKSAFGEGFKKHVKDVRDKSKEIILDEIPDLRRISNEKYPFDTESVQNQFFKIDRISKNSIVMRVPGVHGDCNKQFDMVYYDEMKVVADGLGEVKYRVSLYDDHFRISHPCIKVTLKSILSDKAYITFESQIDNKEGSSLNKFGDTPEELLKIFPVPEGTLKPPTKDPNDWEPGPNLQVQFIEDKELAVKKKNMEVYLKFIFEDEGILALEVYGTKYPPTTQGTTTTTNTTTEKSRFRAKDGEDGPEMPDYAEEFWIKGTNQSLKRKLKKLPINEEMNSSEEFKADLIESALVKVSVSSGVKTVGLIYIIAMGVIVLERM